MLAKPAAPAARASDTKMQYGYGYGYGDRSRLQLLFKCEELQIPQLQQYMVVRKLLYLRNYVLSTCFLQMHFKERQLVR